MRSRTSRKSAAPPPPEAGRPSFGGQRTSVLHPSNSGFVSRHSAHGAAGQGPWVALRPVSSPRRAVRPAAASAPPCRVRRSRCALRLRSAVRCGAVRCSAVATSVAEAGCPSFGGQRTAGAGSAWARGGHVQLWFAQCFQVARHSLRSGMHPNAIMPNPSFKRTFAGVPAHAA